MYNAHYTISNTGSNHRGNKFSCNYSNKDVWSYFNIRDNSDLSGFLLEDG